MPYIYQFIAGAGQDKRPLVLLHGSDGNERELLPLAHQLAPGSPILAIRGTVVTDSGFAFFHRLPDRSIDEADILTRAPTLANLIETCATRHRLTMPPIGIGFSNGAIMAAAVLFTRPTLLAGAILFRPLSPFATDPPARLTGVHVLIVDGEKDNRRLPRDGARLAKRLRDAEATVNHHVLPVGHSISELDVPVARTWLRTIAR